MHVGTQRLIGTFDRRQRETDAPGAEHDRGHDQLQPVEAAGSQEPRNGVRAAFDEDTAQAALGQGSKDCRRSDLAPGLRQFHDLDALRQRRPHAAY